MGDGQFPDSVADLDEVRGECHSFILCISQWYANSNKVTPERRRPSPAILPPNSIKSAVVAIYISVVQIVIDW
jgi:hypothetical protein